MYFFFRVSLFCCCSIGFVPCFCPSITIDLCSIICVIIYKFNLICLPCSPPTIRDLVCQPSKYSEITFYPCSDVRLICVLTLYASKVNLIVTLIVCCASFYICALAIEIDYWNRPLKSLPDFGLTSNQNVNWVSHIENKISSSWRKAANDLLCIRNKRSVCHGNNGVNPHLIPQNTIVDMIFVVVRNQLIHFVLTWCTFEMRRI